jgi:serine/threonine protein kinase
MNGEPGSLPLSLAKRVNEACDRFEAAWKTGERPRIEEYLADVAEPERPAFLRGLLELKIELRTKASDKPRFEEYEQRFPDYLELIMAVFAEASTLDRQCPSEGEGTNSTIDEEPRLPSVSPPAIPSFIGRYKVCQKLGGGAFGDVYLAQDALMDRQVAIKVPGSRLLASQGARGQFLTEARRVARLQHEGIVRAYDFGQETDGRCYIVYEFVEGTSLAERISPKRIASDRLTPEQAARIIAQIADALHYAHLQGLVHRDIKPANILLDRQGEPRITDFGLAVREEDLPGERGRLAGTLPYMSPEQVRREYIDGRSDIYALGVVLYELLCGRRPFEAEKLDELEEQILHREAKPPRQIKDSIPAELERICLKALSKRATDRYTTAKDMAEELGKLTKGAYSAKRFESQVERPREPDHLEPFATLCVTRPEGGHYPLTKDRVTIGRCADCDIVLEDLYAARYHAQLVRVGNQHLVADLNTLNRTYVNGRQIVGRVPLEDNDRIHVGDSILVYRRAGATREREVLPAKGTDRTEDPKGPLQLIWDSLDSNLQDAFSLAYNKKCREGSNRISTRDFFQALLRIKDDALRTLIESLPEGALPDPVPADVGVDRHLLKANPLLSNCVEDSLSHFIKASPLPRKLSPVDIFVDIGQHGHGPSVARLRKHGVTPKELEKRVEKYGLSVLRRPASILGSEAAPSLHENVQFTVYRPKTIRPQQWYPMLAFAHLSERPAGAPANEPDPVQEVKRQASQILDERLGEYREMTQDSTRPVPQESELTFVPEVRGIEFNPTSRSFVWEETVHREEFRLRTSAELNGQTAKGRMTVYLGSLILAEVPLSIRVDGNQESEPKAEPHEIDRARPYRKIFASYARKDSWIVAELKKYAQALGDEYVRKHARLRAGEEWSDRLQQLIEEADIFQLFWSSNSMHSPFVRREWECALSLGRTNFIRPCYWETPLPTCAEKNLPPEELRRVHFQRIPFARRAITPAGDDLAASPKLESARQPARDTEPDIPVPTEVALDDETGEGSVPGAAGPIERAAGPRTIGQYVVDRLIGSGGFGRVYLGHHTSDPLHRLVIKVVSASAHYQELWLQSYRQVAQLQHPGIMKVVDAGVEADQVYVVTDYVAGRDLQTFLRRHRATWQEAARIVAAVAEALDFVHANGVVHRDIRPSHILLTDRDNPLVIGFAVATNMLEEDVTPAYMAPEQLLGERVDGRADIYSLGVVLYEMLCGQRPFATGGVLEALGRVRGEEPTPPRQLAPGIPRELESICLKAMAKRIDHRYRTGADLAADLRRCLEGLPTTPLSSLPAWLSSPAARLSSPTARWKSLVLVALVASAILGGLAWLLLR